MPLFRYYSLQYDIKSSTWRPVPILDPNVFTLLMLSNLPFFLIALIFGSSIGPSTNRLLPTPHILEDGFVERSLSIVVRNSTAYGEYRIGLNNNTMTELVSQWTKPSESELKSKSPTLNSKADGATHSENLASLNQDATVKKTEPQKKRSYSQSLTGDRESIRESTGPSLSPSSVKSETKNPTSEDENHWLDPKVLKQLTTLAHSRLTQELKVQIDGQVVAIKSVEPGPPPRHPFYLSIKFEFTVPDSGSFDLEIRDHVFGLESGAVRYSLKTQGKPMILQSNVAPAIVRSKRVDLRELSAEKRESKTTISAKIGVAASVRETK